MLKLFEHSFIKLKFRLHIPASEIGDIGELYDDSRLTLK